MDGYTIAPNRSADWLVNLNITTAAAKPTANCRAPAFEILKAHGRGVVPVNTRGARTSPRRIILGRCAISASFR
jgi:hypothetical protein